ncbi:MAG: cytochrome c oxidase subunit II [Bacteroidota bacterium]
MSEYLGLPFDASASGGEIDHMIGLVHWLMLVLFVGWGVFFLYCLIRFRGSRNPRANYAGVKSRLSNYTEVGVAIVEGILLIGFAFPIWAEIRNEFPSENNSTIVYVVAEQFAWNVHYAGDDGVFGRRDISLVSAENPLGLDRTDPSAKDDIATINQLNLPVNKPVLVHLTSKDVIHSFGIPVMRVKQDAIPGMTIPVWFVPTQIGQYEIACAQLCGLGHYRMRGFVTIQSKEDFQAWLEEEAMFLREELEGLEGD